MSARTRSIVVRVAMVTGVSIFSFKLVPEAGGRSGLTGWQAGLEVAGGGGAGDAPLAMVSTSR